MTDATHATGPLRAPDVALPDVALRDMRWWDLDGVLALEHALFPEDAWSRGMFWSELADTGHPAAGRTYLVAEDPGGRIVGYAGLAAVAGTADVQTIATARDHWGTGLGARLLTALLRAATAAECHEVLLEVRVDNTRAQRLYRRFGFEPIGFRKGYYQPGNVDALVMRLAAASAQDETPQAGGTEPAEPTATAPRPAPRPAPATAPATAPASRGRGPVQESETHG